MTQLERFRAAAGHRPHEGILFYANFSPGLEENLRKKHGLSAEAGLREHFGMFTPEMVQPAGANKPERDYSAYYSDIEIPEGSKINALGVLHVPGSMHHFTRRISPLRNARRFEDIESFPIPGAVGPGSEGMAERVRQAHADGKAVLTHIGHMYESAWQIRGYEEFLMDMKTNVEWCELILDRLAERNIWIAEAGASAGADYIMTGDDVASQNSLMFSISDWRKFLKSRWEKVYSAARSIKPDIQIWYHSDGNIEQIIPELIEIGVTILNPVQPECMDPAEIKRRYCSRLVIDGTVGTQTTMPFGSPEDVRQVVRDRIDTLGADGALILSPTHVLEPEVPLENVEAFIDEAENYKGGG